MDRQVSPAPAFTLAVGATLVVAAGDYLTGPYLVFATFYLVPVAFTAWFTGRTASLIIAALASILGVASTTVDPGAVSPAVYLANGVLRFVTYAVVAVLLVFERNAMATISALASTDPLTGVLNRRSFYEVAGRELARSRRDGRPLAVVYLDVDDLKTRNDTYGHEAGDAMLAEFADAVGQNLRNTDLFARLGGDEFAALLPECDLSAADAVATRLRGQLDRSTGMPIRFSAGIIAGSVEDDVDIEALVHRADLLMMQAKSAGKGRTLGRGSLRRVDAE